MIKLAVSTPLWFYAQGDGMILNIKEAVWSDFHRRKLNTHLFKCFNKSPNFIDAYLEIISWTGQAIFALYKASRGYWKHLTVDTSRIICTCVACNHHERITVDWPLMHAKERFPVASWIFSICLSFPPWPTFSSRPKLTWVFIGQCLGVCPQLGHILTYLMKTITRKSSECDLQI